MLNLDPGLYAAPRAFVDERERVFARTWQLVGPASEVGEPGSYSAIEIAGLKVFVLRGRDGTLRGFRNVCRHRGARLLEEGTGRCGPIRCPYHNWAYNDDGQLMTAPWFGEDPAFRKEDWPLEAISVRAGTTLPLLNQGGEVHTFTEVAEFAGGVVPVLNALTGETSIAPECLGGAEFVPAGGSSEQTFASPGEKKFMCCIHPWMRALAHVH